MPAKKIRDAVAPRPSTSVQGAWPMVENAVHEQQAPHTPFSQPDEEAARTARAVEARTGLPRAGGGPPSLDRETARALVEAGYMPLADYVALYGAEVAADRRLRLVDPEQTVRVTAHFPVAFPRRQTYRVASLRCTFAKPPRRVERRA